MKRVFFGSIIWKISAIVFLIESFILTSLGIYYTNRFSLEIDKRSEVQVQLPGILMNRQLLMYESVSDRDIMSELVGEEFVDGIVFGADKEVFYALNADYVGKAMTDIPGMDPGWIDEEKTEPRIMKLSGLHDTFLMSMTPLVAYEGAKPFFFVYIKVNTNRSEAQKTTIAGLFIVGSVFCVVLTSLLIIAFMQTLITRPLGNLERNANQLAQGDLERDIETTRQDELGSLARSFVQMRNAIRQKIRQLEELNQTLEHKVKTRTQELQHSVELLQQEITERTRAETELQESEEKFRTLFDHAPVLIDGFDNNGRCVLWNKECENTFGWTKEEMNAYENPLALFYPDPDVRNDVIKTVTSGSDRIFREWHPITKDGTELVTLWANFQLPDGLVINIGYDITARKRMEEQLQQAKERAEAANRAKSVFLANMSHELRSPLTAIIGFAQVMTRSTTLPSEHRENVGIIQRSGEHLLTLINQVLDLSKIEAGRITLNPATCNLHQLLDDVQDMFALRSETKGLRLLFEQDERVPHYIRTDEVKLRQVLINLLNNAVKFTTEGGVAVRVKRVFSNQYSVFSEQRTIDNCMLNTDNCILAFEIEDTGPGIAPEEMDHVFEAFGQTETGRQAQEGTGLGLPISHKFVQLMGGDMQVKSQIGHGTTFTFDIQCEVVDSIDNCQSSIVNRVVALESGQPHYRILIVDDKWTNRQLLTKLLAPLGFDLRNAENGQEAIEIWEAWQPHLIWMDMRMPVMDGYEATKKIRELETSISKHQTPNTIIIALTASVFEEERSAILATGCDDYLRKPFRDDELFVLMRKHLGVKFVYEEGERSSNDNLQATINNVLTPEALAALPAEWLETLRQGAERADLIMLSSAIEQIREQDARLADALAQLAEDFKYDEILVLIQAKETFEGCGN